MAGILASLCREEESGGVNRDEKNSFDIKKTVRAAQYLAETCHGFLRRIRSDAFRVLGVVMILRERLGLLLEVRQAVRHILFRRRLAVELRPRALNLPAAISGEVSLQTVGQASGVIAH